LVESSLKVINKGIAGISGRLSDIVVLNGKILEGIKENSGLIQSLSFKIDGVNDKLSSIDDMLSYIAFGEEK
jgi:hypothetical protein